MTRITPLFESSLLSIERSDHPTDVVHVDGRKRVPEHYELTFVESGAFSVECLNEIYHFTAGDILLSSPGNAQTVCHPEPGAQDVCLSIKFQTSTFEDSIGTRPDRTWPMKKRANSASAFQLQRIRTAVDTRNSLVIEELAILIAHSFVDSCATRCEWAAIDRNLSWYSRRIGRVCDFLNYEYANTPSVKALARIAGISPFHFSRVFHYVAGLPVHQYVVRRQLVASARSISNGQTISDAAFAAGFRSLSYFSRAFHRHFGVAPRTYQKAQRLPSVKSQVM